MLKQLTIKNFALIKEVSIEFDETFNVLTGETGAGKTLIVEAIGLLVGDRASSDFIREECEKAYIEGYFEFLDENLISELENLGLETEDGLILSRELARNGKNACRINGRLVPLSFYSEVGKKLVDIHGQNQELFLLSPAKQMELLDRFAGEEALKHKSIIQKIYKDINELKDQLHEFETFAENKASKLEFLEHQITELENANLRVGEEEELQQERNVLMNFEKLSVGSNLAYSYIFKGQNAGLSAYDLISLAVDELDKLAVLDSSLNNAVDQLRGITYQLDDVASEIRTYADSQEYNPFRLEEIDQRLSLIHGLKRKYNSSTEELIHKLSELKKEQEKLEQSSQELEAYGQKLQQLEAQIYKECEILHQIRFKAVKKLEVLINQALEELDLVQAQFTIKVDKLDSYEVSGINRVEFLFSPNKGESPKPIAKIASGGEMSRVMLAFKSVLNQYDGVPTIIFDEVDTGVGGETIINLSKKISQLAQKSQVICVTHSATLASFAATHFYIYKTIVDNRTVTKVRKLSYQDRIYELGRMLGGAEQIDTALNHAEEMLKFALSEKCV